MAPYCLTAALGKTTTSSPLHPSRYNRRVLSPIYTVSDPSSRLNMVHIHTTRSNHLDAPLSPSKKNAFLVNNPGTLSTCTVYSIGGPACVCTIQCVYTANVCYTDLVSLQMERRHPVRRFPRPSPLTPTPSPLSLKPQRHIHCP